MTAHPTFTPAAADPAELEAVTVGREALFAVLVGRIEGAVRDGARPHTLLIAPRGGGKTHTLHLVMNRSLADEHTANHVLSVMIPEDALAIGNYTDLLVEMARNISPDLADPAQQMRRDNDPVGIEQAIMSAAAGRMILLSIENLDRVFDNLGPTGQGSLRAWVETSAQIMLFATTPMLFPGVSSRSFPWYGSFMVETLPDLTVVEGATMLGRAAGERGDDDLRAFLNTDAGLQRMHVIHRLAGGSPRLWHILSDCVDVESLDALVPAVEALLDRLAPYYQQRLWQLPPGEQRIVVELARGWSSRTVSDIAAAVGVSNQSAATALGRLTKSRWVKSSKSPEGDKRSSWYDLTEPLLRYQLQYREERGKPLRLIVEFLRGFYSRERLIEELAEAIPESSVERHLQQALYNDDKLFIETVQREPRGLLASLRLWMLDEQGAYDLVAIALEAVLVAAQGITPKRRAPKEIAAVVADAIAAQTAHDDLWDKLSASMNALRRHDWSTEADDALCLFEFICSGRGDGPTYQLDTDWTALRGRHTSPPALLLRQYHAFALLKLDQPAEAARFVGEALDDVADAPHVPLASRLALWSLYLQVVAGGSAPSPPREGVVDAGWAVLIDMKRGAIGSEDFDRLIVDAFSETTRGIVAAVVAMGASTLGMCWDADHDPRRHVTEDLRGAVDRFIADQAGETAVRPV